jgi:Trypsin
MTRRPGKIGIAVLIAAATAVPIGTAAASPVRPFHAERATSAAHGKSTMRAHPSRALNSPLGLMPDKIAALGVTRLRSVYTGLVVTDGGAHLDVYLTSLTPSAEAAARRLLPAGTITFRKAPHTRLQVEAVHRQVTRDEPRLAAAGIRLVSWFPGVNGDGLENIGVLRLTKARARTLRRLFGTRNIVLHNVAPSQVPVLQVTRDADSSPWDGGDNIEARSGDYSYGCTSGTAVTFEGTRYMLTAAHCFEPGWTIENAFSGHTGTKMGTEHSRDVVNGGDDTALLSMAVTGIDWTGIIGKPVQIPVAGDATNPDGDTVCDEGAYSGEVCSKVINNDYGCASYKGYVGLSGARTECNLVEATASNNGIAVQQGDSGGPMIRYIDGGLRVTGIVSAGSGSATCVYNLPDTCSSTVYYTAMDEILSDEYPGSSIITG